MAIKVHYQNVKFQLKSSTHIKDWLLAVIKEEGKICGDIIFFFIDDRALTAINQEFLEHDYNTDVITFDYTTPEGVAGEIYISIDTVRENATIYNVSFTNEVKRVMVHGVLHLLGYKDREVRDIELMRSKETYYLKKL